MNTSSCKRCVREGLAILPVLYAVAPKALSGVVPSVGGNFGVGVTDKALVDHIYTLRAPDPGYIYVLYQGKGWQGYLVDASGYLRYYPDLSIEDMPATIPDKSEVLNCKRAGFNHLGVEAMCIDLQMATGAVYVAYSRVRWTRAVRDVHKRNPGARMQQVLGLSGSPFPHAEVLTAANLQNRVVNYKPGATGWFNLATVTYGSGPDRSGSAATLPARTLEMSGQLKKPGLIMALWDPVGITAELNEQRNIQVAKLAQVAGIGTDDAANVERARKRLVAEVIDGLLKNAEANPGPFYDRNYGPERYTKHINQAEWAKARRDSTAFEIAKQRAERASKDYVTWFASVDTVCRANVLQNDYDVCDAASSFAYERAVAATTRGSGTTVIEQERVWWPALVKQATDHDSWFYRAICGSHRDAMDFINQEKKWDKAFDGPKLAEAVVKELYESSVPALVSLHGTLRYLRPANEHTKELVDSVATMLLKMQADPKMRQHFGKLVGRVSTALMVRADVLPRGFKVSGFKQSIALYIQKAISGDTRATLSGLANAQRVTGSVSVSNGATGAVPVDAPALNRQEAEQTAAFMVMRLKSRKLTAADLRALGLDKLADMDLRTRRARGAATANIAMERMANPYAENYAARTVAKVDAGFSAGALFFQMVSFAIALKDLTDPKSDAQRRADGVVGLTTAVLSGAAAILEIRAAAQLMRGATKESIKAIARAGALLGGLANVVEGVWLIRRGRQKVEGGDKDSGLWTIGSGVALVAAGVTGVVGATLATGTIPVVGWALATLVLLGLSLYCAINANSTDDDNLTPVEYWLDNGTFGLKRLIAKDKNPYLKAPATAVAPWGDVRSEIVALQEVLLVVQAEISVEPLHVGTVFEGLFSRNADIARYVSVDLPRWSENSRVVMKMHATTVPKDGQQRFMAMQFEFAGGRNRESEIARQGLEPIPQQSGRLAEIVVTPKGTGSFWKHDAIVPQAQTPDLKVDAEAAQMRIYNRIDIFNTINVRTGPNEIKRADIWTTELTVLYWPDEVDLPELHLKMTGVKEQLTASAAY
ncbi:T6SS effector BTH_I2691 family protein [Piscinibacter gummiphilus]|uniref:T6SS effector BTH_I2691 family protein n=1 Tax=Piscinibacter gummiphilus TaxID=946333 RepID=A0ABZ0CQC1_9BURK|nr:T6SS effector BTH_I2691 family protein [Piscinibacter gummiphilus]WOB07028.1 T6SS effector BTH_I2691 family protein [Piscinibacter gummiphilus]